MAEEKIQKQEIQNLNTFLLAHLGMFIWVILFAVGIKWALETESENIWSQFNTYLAAGITIYILSNTLLRIMHRIEKKQLLSLIGGVTVIIILWILTVSYIISINSYLLATTIILSFITYSLVLNRRIFCR
jgi:low temperature requirement protein LtrA